MTPETPETPDPPPVSPDPWATARARIYGLTNRGLNICAEFTYRNEMPVSCERCGYEADVHLVRDLLTARAADALRHQQETADLTRAVQGNALAVVKASAEGGSQIADLRAALSTAEATIQQQAERIAASERARDAAQQEVVRFLGSGGVSPCGHYGLFMLTTVYEDGAERPECMQCCRDAAQDRADAAEATIASLTAQVEQQKQEIASWRQVLTMEAVEEIKSLRAERDALAAQVTALETELDETSAFIARATTGPDSPLNLAVDVEARAVKAEQERDAAQQESKRWEVHYNEKLLAEMEEFERAERAGKEAQTLREALAKADEALKRLMADQHDCGDPGTECPMHDAHKSWHPVSEALTLIAALTPRPQEPRP